VDAATIVVICLIAILVIMGTGIPLAYVLGCCAVLALFFAWGGGGLSKAGLVAFYTFFKLDWTPLPLFVLLGCVLSETRLSTDIFQVANSWLSRLPGGLVVASIMSEAAMAATIGSSIVTLLVVGKVSVPEMERLGYNKAFSTAAILAGGVLGPLIPPSVTLVIYALFAQESIGRLFMAGVIPGIVLAIMLSMFTILTCLRNPRLAPRSVGVSSRERLASVWSVWKVWPIVVVILSILGGIYLGVMTATEAAGVAVVIALLLCVVFYRFRLTNLFRAMVDAAIINGMICFIIMGAMMLTFMVGTSGLGRGLANFLTSVKLSPWLIVIAINAIYLILGFFMDSISVMMVTLPFLVPLIKSLGFDPIWFGVVTVVNIEIGLITPPMALNMFTAKEVFGLPIGELIRHLVPFLAVLLIFLGIIIAFPQLSLWLPGMMRG